MIIFTVKDQSIALDNTTILEPNSMAAIENWSYNLGDDIILITMREYQLKDLKNRN